jgi:hypothetical protein
MFTRPNSVAVYDSVARDGTYGRRPVADHRQRLSAGARCPY